MQKLSALAHAATVITLLVCGARLRADDLPPSMSEGAWRMRAHLQRRLPTTTVQHAARIRSDTVAATGHNVLVNDPTLDTPDSTTQNETTLAVHGPTLCAGYNNTAAGAFPNGASGYARSADLGSTWTDQRLTAAQLVFGDPALAVHRASGTFYYGELAFSGGRGPDQTLVSTIAVQRSTDDCRSFEPPANASPTAAAGNVCATPASSVCATCARNADCDSQPGAGDGLCTGPDVEDKSWIAVDNSGGARDGTVYACWARFINGFRNVSVVGEIRFSRSDDGGLTFHDDQAISPPTDSFPSGCHVDVGPHSEVYVAWSDYGSQFPIRFRRSQDGGLTWDPPVQVNTLPIRHPGTDRVVSCGTIHICGIPLTEQRPTLNGDVRMAAQAWMAVDTTGGPYTGNIYVAWASDPPGAVDNSDIFISRSTDGGVTWSPEVQIAGGTRTDQFEPFVTVGGSGTVGLVWYDRRNDPTGNLRIDVYTAVSRDGGATWDPIERLTDTSFPVPPLSGQPTGSGNFDPNASACYMGEYIAATADATDFYYAWGDNRMTVVSPAYPRGRPDPNVFFDRRPVPAIAFCAGDCNHSGTVTVEEIVALIDIALGNAPAANCTLGDVNNDGQITVNEILAAINAALNGC